MCYLCHYIIIKSRCCRIKRVLNLHKWGQKVGLLIVSTPLQLNECLNPVITQVIAQRCMSPGWWFVDLSGSSHRRASLHVKCITAERATERKRCWHEPGLGYHHNSWSNECSVWEKAVLQVLMHALSSHTHSFQLIQFSLHTFAKSTDCFDWLCRLALLMETWWTAHT